MAVNPTQKGGIDVVMVDERTPLLDDSDSSGLVKVQDGEVEGDGHEENGVANSPSDGTSEEPGKQMPLVQILVLCYTCLAEPIAYFGIFPIINEMIERTGNVPESDVGFWSGLIESLFSLVQMVVMLFYGRASDTLGRKPVLVFSLVGIAAGTALFGMSQSLWQMILFRCLSGLFAGSAVTIRTMVSENSTKATQGRAFSWYMFTRNIGIFVGPIIGGGLANPAEQFPGTFDTPFWNKYPYALPTYVGAAVVLTCALLALFCLKETLKAESKDKAASKPRMSIWKILKSPGVPMVLCLYGHAMMLALAFTAVVPVFEYTSVEKGGFGFTDPQIALFLAIAGASQALWMLLGFPLLQIRLGTGTVFRICTLVWPVFLVMYPILNEFLRADWRTAFWTLAVIDLVIGSGVSMAFACVQLFINDISPTSAVLGTMNALALTLNSAIRAFSPVVFTSIFAAGVKWGAVHGHLVWFIIVPMALVLVITARFVPPAVEGKQLKTPASNTSSDPESGPDRQG